MALDWDKLNEDCSDISDWTDGDSAGCTSDVVTFDNSSCMRLYGPSSAADGNYAYRYRTLSAVPDTFTLEFKVYTMHNANRYFNPYVAISSANNHLYELTVGSHRVALADSATTWVDAMCHIRLNYEGGPASVLTGQFYDKWHTVRLVVKTGRKADVWIDNRCILANVTCSDTGYTNQIQAYAYADNVYDIHSFFDWFRVDSTPEGQTAISPLRIGTEHVSFRVSQLTSDDVFRIDPSPLKFQGVYLNDAERALGACEIPLVDTSDTNASKVRIYDGTEVKSLQKLPS